METPTGLRIGRSRPYGDRAPILVGGSLTIGDLDRAPPNAGIYLVSRLPTTSVSPCSVNILSYTLIRALLLDDNPTVYSFPFISRDDDLDTG